MNTLAQTQTNVKTQIIPQLHISALYQDSIGYQVILHWCGQGKAIDINNESGKTIFSNATFVNAIDESEGYDNDPSAKIHHLRPNEFVQLLSQSERETVAQFQYDATPRATPRARKPFSGRFSDTGAGY